MKTEGSMEKEKNMETEKRIQKEETEEEKMEKEENLKEDLDTFQEKKENVMGFVFTGIEEVVIMKNFVGFCTKNLHFVTFKKIVDGQKAVDISMKPAVFQASAPVQVSADNIQTKAKNQTGEGVIK